MDNTIGVALIGETVIRERTRHCVSLPCMHASNKTIYFFFVLILIKSFIENSKSTSINEPPVGVHNLIFLLFFFIFSFDFFCFKKKIFTNSGSLRGVESAEQ